MGTRSLTMFYNEKEKEPFVVMYRQFDGYPGGHGRELAEFLSERRLINGIGPRDNSSNAANGMGCLAAQCVTAFKGGEIGNIYLHKYREGDHEDYTYEVHPRGDGYKIVVKSWDETIFSGNEQKFLNFTMKEDG